MRRAALVVSVLALVGTIGPSVLYFAGILDLERTKLVTGLMMAAWFVSAPVWMNRKGSDPARAE